ncbi:MAG: thioredoxin family protein [Nitrospinae bacterium CG22_combo_CG10-13_8_21_14_all_47_10]|nr:MAG: thioredoxin family protein [Nitrospinae bacterium CG22_combo_CG10-13_8_21_14_all_47_10]
MKKAVFYHAGCPVCVSAEEMLIKAIDRSQYNLEVVHFAQSPERIPEAESAGVKSVPAVMLDDQVFHINFGASMADVKAS